MFRFLLLLVLSLWYVSPAWSLTLAPHDGMQEGVTLAGHLAMLRDASGSLSVDEVSRAERAGEFAAVPGVISAGYTTGAIWLRFTLARSADAPTDWWLEAALPILDEVTLYTPQQAGVRPSGSASASNFTAIRLGDRSPYTERPVPHRNFVFPLRLLDDQPVTYYLRVKTTSSMLVSIVAWQQEGLLRSTQIDTGIYAGYFGFILLGILINLAFWAWLREKRYLGYAAYLILLAVNTMTLGGFASQWFFPDSPLLADRSVGVMACLVFLAGFAFFVSVFHLREHFPRINRLIDALLLAYAACVLAALAGYFGLFAAWLQLPNFIIVMCVAVTGPWLVWRGHREYLLYTLAFSAQFVGALIGVTRVLGITSSTLPINYLYMATTLVHVVLLHFAMANRLRLSEIGRLATAARLEKLAAEHEAVEQQRQFVAMVSHEFRTPLAVIDAAAQMVVAICGQEHGDRFEGIRARQKKIRRAVSQMIEMIEAHLTNSRLNVQVSDRRREKFDLRDLLGELEEKWRPMLSVPERLEVSNPSFPLPVEADRQMIQIAFSNLIDNAAKYSPPASPISLSSGRDGDMAWVEITDHGMGIATEEIERIFDKFYRVTTKMKTGGAGLGLYMVQRIIRQHGGDVEVKSTPGRGTCFRLQLPLTK
ncbi:MAG: sensor histidine kinase [Sulfuricella sp.]|nr:sensor histidine kinase [Sulfuricella sp.]